MGHSEADHIARQLKAEKGFFLYKSQSTLKRVCFFLWQKSTQKLHNIYCKHLDFFGACELIRLITKGKKGGIPTALNQEGHDFIIDAASHDHLSIN
ncbi:hypothetical protein AAZA52_07835 [Bacillus sp. JR_3]